jgi:hypothetical protein
MRPFRHLLLLLIVLGIAFAAPPAAPPDFAPIVPITAVIVAIFLAAMNMLSAAVSSPQLEAWAKNELRELIAGVILASLIYGFFVGSTSLTKAITGQGDYLAASQDVINNLLTNNTIGFDRAFADIIKAGTRLRAAATYSPSISIPVYFIGLTYSTSPMGGVAPLFASLSAATGGLANSIFLYEGVLFLLKFCATAVPAVLLPVSLCLRMIPFTRKTGNTLVAICLAGMVLMPFSVILVGELNKAIAYPKVYLTSSQLDQLDPGAWAMTVAEPFCKLMPVRLILSLDDLLFSLVVCLPFLFVPIYGAGLFAVCQPLVQEVIYPILMMAMQVSYDVALAAWIAFAGEGIGYTDRAFDVLVTFLTNVNNAILLSYLDTIVIAIITISGARSISTALGGEWYLAGIQRFV